MSCRVVAQLAQSLDRELLDDCCRELGYAKTSWQENYVIGGNRLTGVAVDVPTVGRKVIVTTKRVAVDPTTQTIVDCESPNHELELVKQGRVIRDAVQFNYDLYDYSHSSGQRDVSPAPIFALRDLYEARQRERVAAKTSEAVNRIRAIAQQRGQRVQVVSQAADNSAVHLQIHC